MLSSGGILPANYGKLQKVDWTRCARTDKGVSSVGNVVSLKLELDPPTLSEMVDRINSNLPPTIRILGIRRVNRPFNAKINADGRVYEYILPTFALSPKFFQQQSPPVPFTFTEEVRKQANAILGLFEGTHNYHNFTYGKSSSEKSAKRYVMSFKCGKAFQIDGMEMVVLTVAGQSFMLNQIRKMVGLLIAVMREGCLINSESTAEGSKGESSENGMARVKQIFDTSYSPAKCTIPFAPSLGLILDKCLFSFWNKKFGNNYGSLTFDESEESRDQFKQSLYSSIVAIEKKESIMQQWLVGECSKFDALMTTNT